MTDGEMEEELDIDTEPPTEEEIRKAVQALKKLEGTRKQPDNSRTAEG